MMAIFPTSWRKKENGFSAKKRLEDNYLLQEL